jgi:hypothetical protein
MSKQDNLPRIENVELVPKSRGRGGAPGFSFQIALVLSAGVVVVLLLSYLVFG